VTALALVIIPIVALWAALTLTMLVMDGQARRRDREQLEVRAWREKVDAMRRMHDEDGAA